mgnify:CR=1 FL=1
MTSLTITEGLAELKTIQKRIQKKVEYIGAYLMRHDAMRDPLERDGGSVEVIRRERQAMNDLEKRHVAIRLAIQQANHKTPVTVEGETKLLAEWLTWRKEVAPGQQGFLKSIRQTIDQTRQKALQKGAVVLQAGGTDARPQDVIVHVDEATIAKEIERLEMVLGGLDGQLSLKNATVLIVIPD